MKIIASAVAWIGLLLVGAAPVHAEEVVPREAWFAAMQDADPAAAVAMYAAEGTGATVKPPADLAEADRARVRGRAVEFGREIPIDEQTARLQVHTSADAWLLLTWRRDEGGWRVVKTEELDPELFLRRGPILWPASGAVAPPASEDHHAFLFRWIRTLRSKKWTEQSMAAEFFLPGKKPTAIRELSLAVPGSGGLPIILIDRVDATGDEVRVRFGSRFRVDLTRLKEGWRITEIVEIPRLPQNVAFMTRAEGEQVVRLASALERAFLPDGSPKVLLEFGIDGDGAKPMPYSEASAKLQLERWRARCGPIRVVKVEPRDFERLPVQSTLNLSFTTTGDAPGGQAYLVRRPEGWRILRLSFGAEETEFVHVEDVVEPPR